MPLTSRAKSQRFVRDRQALDELLLGAKQMKCPHCHRIGMLIGHGFLVGYDEHGSDRVSRGRRFLCSNRFLRSGCGRTFSVWIASVLAGFVVRTEPLSRLLRAVVSGQCVKAAWERHASSGLTLRSGYRLWHRLMAAQSHLRTALCSTAPPPACNDHRPLAQLLCHLQHALGPSECVLAAFQLSLQRHLLA